MSKVLEIYDIESISNLFTYTGYRPSTNSYYQFVIHNLQNDYKELILHLQTEDLFQCGFNNCGYDYPVLHHLLNHFNEYQYLDGESLAKIIYQKSQTVIDMEFSIIADRNCLIPQLDLFLLNHYNNKSKHCSLKQLEIAMRLENVEEMPFGHTYNITTLEEIEKVLAY